MEPPTVCFNRNKFVIVRYIKINKASLSLKILCEQRSVAINGNVYISTNFYFPQKDAMSNLLFIHCYIIIKTHLSVNAGS